MSEKDSSSPPPTSPKDPKDPDAGQSAEDLKTLGNDAFGEQQYSKAIRYYSSAISRPNLSDKMRVQLLTNRAACYASLELAQLTIDDCTRALQINPTHVKALYRKGKALMAIGKPHEAARTFTLLADIDDNNDDVFVAMWNAQKEAMEAGNAMDMVHAHADVKVCRVMDPINKAWIACRMEYADCALLEDDIDKGEKVDLSAGPAYAWIEADLHGAIRALKAVESEPHATIHLANSVLAASMKRYQSTKEPDAYLSGSPVGKIYSKLLDTLRVRKHHTSWVHERLQRRDWTEENAAFGADRLLVDSGEVSQFCFYSPLLQELPQFQGRVQELDNFLLSATADKAKLKDVPVTVMAASLDMPPVDDRHKVRYTHLIDDEHWCMFEFYKDYSPEEVLMMLQWGPTVDNWGPQEITAANLSKVDTYLYWSCLQHFATVANAVRIAAIRKEEVAPSAKVLAYKEKGNNYFKKKENDAALDNYTKGISLMKGNDNHSVMIALLSNRAAVWNRMDKPQKAIEDCSRILAVIPRHFKARYRRIEAYRALSKLDEALADAALLDVNGPDALGVLMELDMYRSQTTGRSTPGSTGPVQQAPNAADPQMSDPSRAVCQACLEQEPTKGTYLSCSACKVMKYCNAACQKKHWKIHKKSCTKVAPDKAWAVVMPAENPHTYFAVQLPRVFPPAIIAVAEMLKCHPEEVEECVPAKGQSAEVEHMRFYQSRSAAKRRADKQNIRASLILTPSNMLRGPQFQKSDTDGAGVGTVIAVRFAAGLAPMLDNLTIPEYEAHWGLMTYGQVADDAYCGRIISRTKQSVQRLVLAHAGDYEQLNQLNEELKADENKQSMSFLMPDLTPEQQIRSYLGSNVMGRMKPNQAEPRKLVEGLICDEIAGAHGKFVQKQLDSGKALTTALNHDVVHGQYFSTLTLVPAVIPTEICDLLGGMYTPYAAKHILENPKGMGLHKAHFVFGIDKESGLKRIHFAFFPPTWDGPNKFMTIPNQLLNWDEAAAMGMNAENSNFDAERNMNPSHTAPAISASRNR
eukprot:NODE_131_length_3220_cov_11.999354_g122_i0.p1 GENE.NODE_131_length_3220_cov_11.999354_g122_i0~~NODE_131_length_3220_cov_11.999354_g122_i0.p1  ORF type:complete len:1048 (-),score=242.87 NODE_131_length_3220_cov_11.999354_g122_i0:77-3178(-)